MKKNFLFVLVLSVSATTFCQQTQPKTSLTRENYLQKAKKQNATAWVLLGSGFAVTSAGIITGINGTADEFAGIFTGENSNTLEVGGVMIYTGLAAMAGSIPFFIASSRNKKRAMSLSLKNEKAQLFSKQSFVNHSIPSISLKLSL